MSTCVKGEFRHSRWILEHTDLRKEKIFGMNVTERIVDALLMNEFLEETRSREGHLQGR